MTESSKPANKWEEIATMESTEENLSPDLKEENEASLDAESESQEAPSVVDDAKIMSLEQEVAKQKEAALRAVAELENVRRRATRDVENAHKYGVEKLLKELLPVVDSLEQALQADDGESTSGGAMREGMELTLSLFMSALEKFSLVPVSPEGEIFDPMVHEAMSMQPNDEVPNNTILFVIQKGYVLNGRVVRPARVIVSKASSTGSSSIDEKV